MDFEEYIKEIKKEIKEELKNNSNGITIAKTIINCSSIGKIYNINPNPKEKYYSFEDIIKD